jgi:hypothetical protein
MKVISFNIRLNIMTRSKKLLILVFLICDISCKNESDTSFCDQIKIFVLPNTKTCAKINDSLYYAGGLIIDQSIERECFYLY